ncbi:MAG TPA: hypothetical protein VN626_05305, partial [Clostridia bacterium]|nr:hypothetical protein [Clostridia bacterium]
VINATGCAQCAPFKASEGECAASMQPTPAKSARNATTQGYVLVNDFNSKETIYRAHAAKVEIMAAIQRTL